MKTQYESILISIFLFLGYSVGSFAQYGPPWVKYNVGYNYILMGIDFPGNQNTIGYIAGESVTYQGNGIVLKTTDGGNTWNSVWQGAGMGLEACSFVDVNTGFVAGWPKPANGWSGFGKTTDGGTTWTSINVVSDLYYFTDVVFKDASSGIVVGATNTSAGVWVTSNGGSSWVAGTGASNGVPMGACYVSGNTYFLVDNGGRIKKSVDNGLSWTTVYTIPGLILTGIDFYNDNIGMVSGDNGVLARTSDGGQTWQVQQLGTDIWRDYGWESQDHVFCCGTPEIVAESIDGGVSWVNGFPQSTFQNALYECIFTENGTGFICGSQGTLLKRMPSCTAAFTSGDPWICTGNQVAFTNQSIGDISTYDWSFPGGIPATSNQPDPVVTYSSPGIYNVTLIVNNGYWSDTITKTSYVHVTNPVTPVITASGTQLTSNTPSGNQWYYNGMMIPWATSQTYLATLSGCYWDVVTIDGCSGDTSNNICLVMTCLDQTQKSGLKVSCNQGSLFSIQFQPAGQAGGLLEVFDLSGSLIFAKENAFSGACEPELVDLSAHPKGIYVVRLFIDDQVFVSKLLNQN